MHRLFSYISGDTLTYFHIIPIFITYPFAPAEVISITLNRCEEGGHPCFACDLSGNNEFLPIWYDIACLFAINWFHAPGPQVCSSY